MRIIVNNCVVIEKDLTTENSITIGNQNNDINLHEQKNLLLKILLENGKPKLVVLLKEADLYHQNKKVTDSKIFLEDNSLIVYDKIQLQFQQTKKRKREVSDTEQSKKFSKKNSTTIPKEIIEHIVDFMNPQIDLFSFKLVNKDWSQVMESKFQDGDYLRSIIDNIDRVVNKLVEKKDIVSELLGKTDAEEDDTEKRFWNFCKYSKKKDYPWIERIYYRGVDVIDDALSRGYVNRNEIVDIERILNLAENIDFHSSIQSNSLESSSEESEDPRIELYEQLMELEFGSCKVDW